MAMGRIGLTLLHIAYRRSFCMGGALTLATAALVEKPLQACAPFYGIPPAQLCDVAVLKKKTPIQGHYGDLDHFAGFSDKPSVDTLEETLKNADGDQEVQIYRVSFPTLPHLIS